MIQIREDLQKEFDYLEGRIEQIDQEEFHLYEFCEKFTELYRVKLEFPKLFEANRFSGDKGNINSLKTLPSYNLN